MITDHMVTAAMW